VTACVYVGNKSAIMEEDIEHLEGDIHHAFTNRQDYELASGRSRRLKDPPPVRRPDRRVRGIGRRGEGGGARTERSYTSERFLPRLQLS